MARPETHEFMEPESGTQDAAFGWCAREGCGWARASRVHGRAPRVLQSSSPPELDEYGIPAPEKRSREWITWVLQSGCLAGGIAAMYVAIVAGASTHGVRWRTFHPLPTLPGWLAWAGSIATAIWKGSQKDRGKLGWAIIILAFALASLSALILSGAEPYTGGGGA